MLLVAMGWFIIVAFVSMRKLLEIMAGKIRQHEQERIEIAKKQWQKRTGKKIRNSEVLCNDKR